MNLKLTALAIGLMCVANVASSAVIGPETFRSMELAGSRLTTPHATEWLAQSRRTAPPSNYPQRWYTTPDNCTYSRAQAPGYAPMWILVLNPHHVGKPNAHSGCPGML